MFKVIISEIDCFFALSSGAPSKGPYEGENWKPSLLLILTLIQQCGSIEQELSNQAYSFVAVGNDVLAMKGRPVNHFQSEFQAFQMMLQFKENFYSDLSVTVHCNALVMLL